MNSVDSVTQMTIMFQQAGPFFMSILFLVVFSTWAYRRYKAASDRVPPLPAADVATHRSWYIGSLLIGCSLTIAATVYWFKHEPIYKVKGKVVGLTSNEEIWGEDDDDANGPYIRAHFHKSDPTGQTRDAVFVIVRSSPVAAGDSFTLWYRKDVDLRAVPLQFTYDGTSPDLKHDYDPQRGDFLAPANPPAPKKTSWKLDLLHEAYAQTPPAMRGAAQAQLSQPSMSQAEIIRALQAQPVRLGSEILAINSALALSVAERNALLASNGTSEPLLITVLDLTRHEEKELSYKASLLLKGVDVDGILRAKLTDKNSTVRAMYAPLLLRIDSTQAKQIIKSIAKPSAEVSDAKRRLEPPWTPRLITAAPSAEGDRYWLVAEWPVHQSSAQLCVSKVIASSDFVRRRGNPVLTSSKRLTYSYTKQWVLSAADEVERCGGDVSFRRTSS